MSNHFKEGQQVHGTPELLSGVKFKAMTEFDANPPLDVVSVKDGQLWIYSEINGVTTWSPLNGATKAAHVHTQASSKSTWTVNHENGTSNYLLVVYSDSGNVIIPQSHEAFTDNQVVINFSVPIIGKAILFFANGVIEPTVGANYITVETQLTSKGTTVLKGDVTVTGDIVPENDEESDLGSPDKKFRDLYLSGNTIHLGDLKVKDTGNGGLTIVAEDETGSEFDADLMTREDVIALVNQMNAAGYVHKDYVEES